MSTNAMIFLVAWVGITLAFPWFFRKRGVQECQMIATGLGILGTFIGIVWGLWNFNTSDIESAVPELLDGLKFAFITSIIGMGYSLLIGFFAKFWSSNDVQEDENKSDHEVLLAVVSELQKLNNSIAGDDDSTLVTQMQKLRVDFKDGQKDGLSELQKLNNSIAGDDDSTLVTQIQKLRSDSNDKQDKLKEAFDKFAVQMAENNVKSLVEAVNKVMEDFNTQINDQLGDNFKQLNEGVEKLLQWQGEYKQQITESTEALQVSGESMRTSMKALQKSNEASANSIDAIEILVEQSQNFNESAVKLNESLETMGASMTGMKELANTLSESGEDIRNEMREITTTNIAELGENLAGISEALVTDYKKLQEVMSEIVVNR